MRQTFVLLALLVVLGGCASRFGGAIRQVNPDTYQITHTMGKFSPVKGVRQGVIDRAAEKCASMGKSYSRVREEMSPEGVLGYTLTFQCK